MAEIEIERKPPRRTGMWIAVVLGLIVLAGAAWYYLAGPGVAEREGPAVGDTADVMTPMPPSPLPSLPGDTGAPYDTVGGSVADTGGAAR
ncbi:MAG: hypothetical protein KY453_01780 [Gemmatimonadetes bacterium]|nr:hypothetical protein [Gemmatimonadota bacterium]